MLKWSRPLLSLALGLGLAVSAAAQRKPGPGLGGSRLPPPEIALTSKDVEGLLVVIPEVAKIGAKYQAKAPSMGGMEGGMGAGMAANPNMMGAALTQQPEALEELQAMLTKHGYTLPTFAQKMAALVSTYLALSPEAFEKNLPSESHPEMQRLLNDPHIAPERKEALRSQIAVAQQNKELLRAQLTQLASEKNRKVVSPMLPKVKAALDLAQEEIKKSVPQAKGPRRGPRKR